MANEENLKPCRSESEAREIGKKGGIASGEARRRKRMMKDIALFQVYEMKLSDALRQSLKEQGIDEEGLNHANVMISGQIAKAEQGDTAAFNALLALMGEKPKDEIDISGFGKMEIGMVRAEHDPKESEDEIE